MRLQSLAVIASVVGLASTQTINLDDVPIATRDQWCQAQTSSCPLLCLQMKGTSSTPTENTCDPKTLSYFCTCDNGQSPNATEYSQTIPYFICTEQNNQCVSNCDAANQSCQSDCRTKNPCGAQNPQRYNATSTATSTPAATTSLAPFTGVPEEGAAMKPLAAMNHVYASAAVVGAFLAGFAALL
ncbi:hypothetical protein FE257_007817 [Aspergillus nanangensis]|uniref:DUF7707 domain-containing protein n=1 Tax=Aspergillus nanangensis TaxID=2582783 RepID=A0AAD4GXY0_ASPNN|nr:hypothetical protein FE257_007817 [Aspergillus nanangensis]